MSVWTQLRRLVEDPPPAVAFEVSPAGIAVARCGPTPQIGFLPLEPDILSVSPVRDNVLRPEALLAQVAALAPRNGNRRRRQAALILPDYCARVTVLDFDAFPSERHEQLSLVRFRMKKAVPFDLESAALSYHVQSQTRRGKVEVVAAVVAGEIAARYEAPFLAAGFLPGFVTTSALAGVDLLPTEGMLVTAKRIANTIAVTVTEGRNLRLLRCAEMTEASEEEVMAFLHPTFAYAEDELAGRPGKILLCGFGDSTSGIRRRAQEELRVPAEELRSRFGTPDGTNAGLLGYLEAIQER